jgi:hypothetical protein
MVTALLLALTTSCAAPPTVAPRFHPPAVRVACEGADQVRRNHDGIEVGRVVDGCTRVSCEGADRVRRTFDGRLVSRQVNACIRTRCEGFDTVRRAYDGSELSRIWQGCGRPQPTSAVDVPRYGLSYR